ncbi:hypothetical protein ACH5RR_008687 [Cinchona calisaya]|uniref:Strictosidine synthase conserved region domain-containing protein n=1 Tax=Cinchona calisaya TaxID=153742 RepID=A0ABD3AFY9_9GENT
MTAPLPPRFLATVMVVILLFSTLQAAESLKLDNFKKLVLPAHGGESFAFDSKGYGPYTGVSDGRVVKYLGPEKGFVDFATTSAKRTKEQCDGSTDIDLEPICGRPMGLAFNHRTGELFVNDARKGPMVVGPEGGLATHLDHNNPDLVGVPTDLPDGLDVDPVTDTVFFTYVGPIFLSNDITKILESGDTSGRLMKYNPDTKKVTLALDGLSGPIGVSASKDGSFVLIPEYITRTIRKFWLKGPKANTSEVLVKLPGHPHNVKRTESGDFWVAETLPSVPFGRKINADGQILDSVRLDSEYENELISEVNEHLGSLYIGGGYTNFVGVFRGFSEIKDEF